MKITLPDGDIKPGKEKEIKEDVFDDRWNIYVQLADDDTGEERAYDDPETERAELYPADEKPGRKSEKDRQLGMPPKRGDKIFHALHPVFAVRRSISRQDITWARRLQPLVRRRDRDSSAKA